MGDFITVSEAAQRLCVSAATVYRWLRAGSLDGYKLGGVWRVLVDDLDKFVRDSKNREEEQ
jgi:excisionase family DNA binding protein